MSDFNLSLPSWAVEENAKVEGSVVDSVEERMRIINRFARLNVEYDTGGPFAAGVFERETGKVVVIGVNQVMSSGCSSAHAEIMALSLAQKRIGTFDLGGEGQPVFQLVVNWLPCCMCFGATLWSGIRSLAIAGSDGRLETITGFDEGPRVDHEKELGKRGIELIDNVLTEDALEVYRYFKEKDRTVYNARGMGAIIPSSTTNNM